MSRTPKAGDTVYSVNGQMAMYVSTANGGGHIVQPLIEDGDGVSEPESHYADGVDIWPTVYLEPPKPKLDAEIARQQEKLTALRVEVSELERQKREAAQGQREVKERLAQHTALRYIDEMVAGRVPPLCVRFHAYRAPEIIPTADALKNPDRDRSYREPAFKLLTLFGSSAGDLQWHVNHYSDGSGQWTELHFVATQDEGLAEIRRRYALAVDEWRARGEDRKHYGDAIGWAVALPNGWIEVPEDVAAYIDAKKREAARQAHEKARQALADAEQALRAVEAA